MSMLFQALVGISATPPVASSFLTVVDATNGGAGPTKHYRLNEASGAFVDRKGAGAAGSESGATLVRTAAPLVANDVGGGSIGLKGAEWVNVADIVESASATFTLAVVWVPDGQPSAKVVLASSPNTRPGS